MAARKLLHKLINRTDITSELRLIKGSLTDYITKDGHIFKDYGNGKMLPKKISLNKHNGYLYCGITYPNGQRQRRVHILVAEVFLDNPNNFPIVLHKDNNKANPSVENLKWSTVSENTKQAFDDGLAKNDKGWDDSQSIPVVCFDMKQNELKRFGSVSEAANEFNMTKTGILYQCRHKIKTKPKKGYYFRFLSEVEQNGFVL